MFFTKISKKKMKKMNIIDVCHEVGGPNDKIAREVLEERGDTYLNEMLKLDKMLEIKIPKDNVYNLKFREYSFPISKEIYAMYCRNFGFMTEDDIEFILRHHLKATSYNMDEYIKDEGEFRLAGVLNYIILNYLRVMKITRRGWLNENEIGHSFVFGNEDRFFTIAISYGDYKNYNFPDKVVSVINKWRKEFENYKDIPRPGALFYIEVLLTVNGEMHCLQPIDFNTYYYIIGLKEDEIIKDFENIGVKAYFRHI